jgi:TolA-binding protein
MKRLGIPIVAGLLLWILSFPAFSQQTLIYENPEAEFRSALELFQAQKYAWARQKFLEVSEQIPDKASLIKERAEYYAAICGVELFNNNTEPLLVEFLDNYTVTSYEPEASFALARMEYRKGSYTKAIQSFLKVDRSTLDKKERDEYNFKLGYSYLKAGKADKATPYLEAAKASGSVYESPATYYLAHIAYLSKDFPKALKGFNALREDPSFKPIVPYYIIQIEFMQGNYEAVMKDAPAMLAATNAKRTAEISKMAGEAYFKAGKYTEAIPYLETYTEKSSRTPLPEDYYELGYAYYQDKKYEKAIANLNKATAGSDTLGQSAFYHLGDCYLKTGQKKFALNSFYSAYKTGPDPVVREDALFNYAKLSYELGYNPYNEAVKALKQYLADFPQTKRADEAKTYLVNLLVSTRSYADALRTIEEIKTKSEKLLEIRQQLNYYMGVDEFNAGNFAEATQWFEKASGASYDRSIAASAIYWCGESQFRLGNYTDAAAYYRQYQLTPGAFGLEYFTLANYNLGYCAFKKKDYDKGLTEFRKVMNSKNKVDGKVLGDACLRAGDCYFALSRFDEAAEAYEEAVRLNKGDVEYGMYQKAIAYGASGRFGDKAATLERFIETFPKSSMQPEARYELGLAYLLKNDESKALQTFNTLAKQYPASHFVKNALLRAGLVYYNKDDNENALKTFKKVVTDYPATPESKEALVSIRNIYVDMNKVDDFFVYAKNIPFANVSNAEQDSITYLAAENRYLGGDCNSSSQGFRDYLNKFPQGFFRTHAQFYLAECLYKENKGNEAVALYAEVIKAPKSKFTETSLLNAAAIYFSVKDYQKALESYTALKSNAENPNHVFTAEVYIMRCNAELKKHQETIEASNTLLASDKITDELAAEAWLTQAKAALILGNKELAATGFEKTYKLAKNERGAEAKFNLSALLYEEGSYKEAEKTIFDFINEFPSYDYWLARSFILLADVYLKLDNAFQSKQTLQSVIDNYEGQDLVDLAKSKLNAILQAEKDAEIKKADEALKKETEEFGE